MIQNFIGIDVGKSGGITIITQGADWLKVKSHVTPTLPSGDIDVVALYNILTMLDGVVQMVVIEKVHAIFGSAAGAIASGAMAAGGAKDAAKIQQEMARLQTEEALSLPW